MTTTIQKTSKWIKLLSLLGWFTTFVGWGFFMIEIPHVLIAGVSIIFVAIIFKWWFHS